MSPADLAKYHNDSDTGEVYNDEEEVIQEETDKLIIGYLQLIYQKLENLHKTDEFLESHSRYLRWYHDDCMKLINDLNAEITRVFPSDYCSKPDNHDGVDENIIDHICYVWECELSVERFSELYADRLCYFFDKYIDSCRETLEILRTIKTEEDFKRVEMKQDNIFQKAVNNGII